MFLPTGNAYEINIGSVWLHELRGEIFIIPQDSILFSALRFALDPFSSFQDEQLWQVLREVQLSDKVNQLEGQLGFSVSEGGSNSVWERDSCCVLLVLSSNGLGF